MYLVSGSNWQLGVGLLFIANLALGSSLVVYDAILCQIATADERDRVSSRGWALGYLGGFLLLAVNLAMVTMHDTFGLSKGDAVRVSLGLAGVWWGAFTLIPVLGLRDRPPVNVEAVRGGVAREAFGQLAGTFRHMRGYRNTMLFLLAYLFFNDGQASSRSSSRGTTSAPPTRMERRSAQDSSAMAPCPSLTRSRALSWKATTTPSRVAWTSVST
jgi:UMF1 family MFS transporter